MGKKDSDTDSFDENIIVSITYCYNFSNKCSHDISAGFRTADRSCEGNH